MLIARLLSSTFLRSPDDGAGGGAPVEPAAPVADAAATADAPVVDAAATEAAPAADATKLEPAAGASLLEEAAAKAAEKAAAAEKPAEGEAATAADADKKPVEEAKPGEGDGEKKAAEGETEPKAEAEQHKPFEFQDFTVPDGMAVDKEKVKEFTGILDNPELNPQERGQKLMDLYASEAQRFTETLVQHQQDVWKGITDGWKEDFRKDPEIGGARMDTTLLTAAHLVGLTLPEEEAKEYMNLMSVSGVGNHRLHLKLLANLGKAMNVFEDGITVPPAQKPTNKREFGAGWYGNGNGSAQ